MQIRAYAKINWALRVTGKRADGYHDIETVMQTISLYDTITYERAPELSLTCSDPTIPVDDRNLVMRAAKLTITGRLHLEKRIPAGGGLGGGSSDAAAILAFADEFDLNVASSLGSDVPFFIHGGMQYAIGRGEVLTPLPAVSHVPLLLLIPEERVSTAEAYGLLRRFSPPLGVGTYRRMIADDLLGNTALLVNDFEEPIFARIPRLAALKGRLYEAGAAFAAMSGSGSTIFGAFRSAADRDRAAARFTDVHAVACETI